MTNALPTPESLQRAWQLSHESWPGFMARLDKKQTPYLSYTKVACLERCPRCYHRQYILGETEEPSNAMRLGQLFHQAAREYYGTPPGGSTPQVAGMMKSLDVRGLPKDYLALLRNAVTLLRLHHWHGHEVVAIEEPFFIDLSNGLPTVIGVPDLVLRRQDSLLVIDHKTSKTSGEPDPTQLVLYAEHLRRAYDTNCIVGVFDQYRLVPDLSKVIKPAFLRTPVSVDRSLLKPLIGRYRRAWRSISKMRRSLSPETSPDCWKCKSAGKWW